MKKELLNHLIPLGVLFLLTSFFWIFNQVPYYQYIFLFLGLTLGSFLLDFDHILYWLFLKPNTEESRHAQELIRSKKIFKVIKLLEQTHKKHTSMVFHHFFFQVILGLISFFVYTSTDNVFVMALVLSLNVHLLVDEIEDFIYQPRHLQDWLFAREEKQLPVEQVRYYLILFIFFSIFFTFLLIRSNL